MVLQQCVPFVFFNVQKKNLRSDRYPQKLLIKILQYNSHHGIKKVHKNVKIIIIKYSLEFEPHLKTASIKVLPNAHTKGKSSKTNNIARPSML